MPIEFPTPSWFTDGHRHIMETDDGNYVDIVPSTIDGFYHVVCVNRAEQWVESTKRPVAPGLIPWTLKNFTGTKEPPATMLKVKCKPHAVHPFVALEQGA